MKSDIITYKIGSFTDFKGVERIAIACVASMSIDENAMTAQWNDYSEYYDLVRAVSIGIAVYNPEDEFDLEQGKQIALNRAYQNTPAYFIVKGGHLDDNITDAILTNALNNLAKNPNSVIKGYNEAKEKYEALKKSESAIDEMTDEEMAVVDAFNDGVDVMEVMKKAFPYLNALKNNSKLAN